MSHLQHNLSMLVYDLKSINVFKQAGLQKPQLLELVDVMQVRAYKKDEPIIELNRDCEAALFLVLDGGVWLEREGFEKVKLPSGCNFGEELLKAAEGGAEVVTAPYTVTSDSTRPCTCAVLTMAKCRTVFDIDQAEKQGDVHISMVKSQRNLFASTEPLTPKKTTKVVKRVVKKVVKKKVVKKKDAGSGDDDASKKKTKKKSKSKDKVASVTDESSVSTATEQESVDLSVANSTTSKNKQKGTKAKDKLASLPEDETHKTAPKTDRDSVEDDNEGTEVSLGLGDALGKPEAGAGSGEQPEESDKSMNLSAAFGGGSVADSISSNKSGTNVLGESASSVQSLRERFEGSGSSLPTDDVAGVPPPTIPTKKPPSTIPTTKKPPATIPTSSNRRAGVRRERRHTTDVVPTKTSSKVHASWSGDEDMSLKDKAANFEKMSASSSVLGTPPPTVPAKTRRAGVRRERRHTTDLAPTKTSKLHAPLGNIDEDRSMRDLMAGSEKMSAKDKAASIEKKVASIEKLSAGSSALTAGAPPPPTIPTSKNRRAGVRRERRHTTDLAPTKTSKPHASESSSDEDRSLKDKASAGSSSDSGGAPPTVSTKNRRAGVRRERRHTTDLAPTKTSKLQVPPSSSAGKTAAPPTKPSSSQSKVPSEKLPVASRRPRMSKDKTKLHASWSGDDFADFMGDDDDDDEREKPSSFLDISKPKKRANWFGRHKEPDEKAENKKSEEHAPTSSGNRSVLQRFGGGAGHLFHKDKPQPGKLAIPHDSGGAPEKDEPLHSGPKWKWRGKKDAAEEGDSKATSSAKQDKPTGVDSKTPSTEVRSASGGSAQIKDKVQLAQTDKPPVDAKAPSAGLERGGKVQGAEKMLPGKLSIQESKNVPKGDDGQGDKRIWAKKEQKTPEKTPSAKDDHAEGKTTQDESAGKAASAKVAPLDPAKTAVGSDSAKAPADTRNAFDDKIQNKDGQLEALPSAQKSVVSSRNSVGTPSFEANRSKPTTLQPASSEKPDVEEKVTTPGVSALQTDDKKQRAVKDVGAVDEKSDPSTSKALAVERPAVAAETKAGPVSTSPPPTQGTKTEAKIAREEKPSASKPDTAPTSQPAATKDLKAANGISTEPAISSAVEVVRDTAEKSSAPENEPLEASAKNASAARSPGSGASDRGGVGETGKSQDTKDEGSVTKQKESTPTREKQSESPLTSPPTNAAPQPNVVADESEPPISPGKKSKAKVKKEDLPAVTADSGAEESEPPKSSKGKKSKKKAKKDDLSSVGSDIDVDDESELPKSPKGKKSKKKGKKDDLPAVALDDVSVESEPPKSPGKKSKSKVKKEKAESAEATTESGPLSPTKTPIAGTQESKAGSPKGGKAKPMPSAPDLEVEEKVGTKKSKRSKRRKNADKEISSFLSARKTFEDKIARGSKRVPRPPKNVFQPFVNLPKDYKPPVHEKTKSEEENIRDALSKRFVFQNLPEHTVSTLVSAFKKKKVSAGKLLVEEGKVDDYFYIVSKGECQFEDKNGVRAETAKSGDSFGEDALVFLSPRDASARTTTDTELFRIDQKTFRFILQSEALEDKRHRREILKKIELLQGTNPESMEKLVNIMDPVKFEQGDDLTNSSHYGESFFVITEGNVECRDVKFGKRSKPNQKLGPGEFFGKHALVEDPFLKADVVALTKGKAYKIDRDKKDKVLGTANRIPIEARTMGSVQALYKKPFKKLKPEEILKLSSLIRDESFPKGTTIIEPETEQEAAVYFLREGKVHALNGRNLLLLTTGTHFGESIFEDAKENKKTTGKTPEKVTAEEDCVVGVLKIRDWYEAFGKKYEDTAKKAESDAVFKDAGMSRDEGASKGKSDDLLLSEDLPKKKKCKVTLDDLDKRACLGEGEFGQIWLCADKTKKSKSDPYVLKIMSKSHLIAEGEAEMCIREKTMLLDVYHPFIVDLMTTYQDESFVFMLMEFVQGGELFSVMNSDEGKIRLEESQAKFYALVIADALAYLHQKKYVYRDLKPENVMIDASGYPKLIDFGFAKKVEDHTFTLCGTPGYLAPEIVASKGHNWAADHWALGVLIYEMVSGESPFYEDGIEQFELFRSISEDDFPYIENISHHAYKLISDLLVKDPTSRIGSLANGEKDILMHPWFDGLNVMKLRHRQVKAPWKPKVKDPFDTSNFDDWSGVEDKMLDKGPRLSKKHAALFEGF